MKSDVIVNSVVDSDIFVCEVKAARIVQSVNFRVELSRREKRDDNFNDKMECRTSAFFASGEYSSPGMFGKEI